MEKKKDTKEFSNESFRERILAQLEENRKKASQFDDDLFEGSPKEPQIVVEDSSFKGPKENQPAKDADLSVPVKEEKNQEDLPNPVPAPSEELVSKEAVIHNVELVAAKVAVDKKQEDAKGDLEPKAEESHLVVGEIEPQLELAVEETDQSFNQPNQSNQEPVFAVMASQIEDDDNSATSKESSQVQIEKDSHMEDNNFDSKESLKEEDFRQNEADLEPSNRFTNRTDRTEYTRVNKKKQKSIARKIITAVSLILLVLLAVAGFMGYRYIESSLGAMDKANGNYVTIEVPNGSSNKQIGTILEKNGIIKSATAFQYYTKFKSQSSFKSGYYNFSPSMDLEAITEKLSEGGTEQPQVPSLGKVTIPEGYTLEQIAEAITVNAGSKDKAASPFTKEDFMKVVSDDAFVNQMKAKYPQLTETMGQKGEVKYQLEGYLFPATYEYTKDSTVESLAEEMVAAMNSALTPFYEQIKAKNLTVNEVLSLAALVEKEGANDEDRRNIAQVFYNRLTLGMPLQSNITILYAEGKSGQKTTLKEDASIDTYIDSPYNLYIHTGFGPGPVANPGLAAIKATISPKDNNYLYFVADVTTGKVYFSETLEEHDEYVKKYVNDQIQ